MLEIIGRISTGLTALMWIISFVLYRKNLTNEKFEGIFFAFTYCYSVEYWQPLPELPKEDGAEE